MTEEIAPPGSTAAAQSPRSLAQTNVPEPAPSATQDELEAPLPEHTSDQDPLTEIIQVERNGLDLPAFLQAAAAELQHDRRIEVLSTEIDGYLRADAVPVGVNHFRASMDGALPIAGRQYTLATSDGHHFIVVTCVTSRAEVEKCDEAARALELATNP